MKHERLKFRLRDLITGQKLLWCVSWVLGIATVLSVLGLTMLAGWFITMAGVAGVLVSGYAFSYALPSLVIRGLAFVRTLARYGDLMVSHHAVFGLLKDLRVRFFSRWAKLPSVIRMSGGTNSAETMQRLVRDIDTLDEFPLRVVSPTIVAVIAVLVLSVVLLFFVPMSAVSVLLLVLTLLCAMFALYRGMSMAQVDNELITERKTKLLNTLPALTSLLTWGRWQDTSAQLSSLDERHLSNTNKIMHLRRNTQAVIQLLIALAVVVLLLIAGRYFEQSAITPSVFTQDFLLNPAIILALMFGVFGLTEIVLALVAEPLAWGRSLQAKGRINELLVEHHCADKQSMPAVSQMSLVQLSIKMPKAILGVNHINAVLSTDKPTLLIGASGAGKSTLLATVAGEVPRIDGKILLDGVDIDTIDCGSSLGYLGQNVDIFDQTLADNLRLGKPSASDDELWVVLDKVNLSAWVKTQPKGLATPLGEYGMAISGGQGRRVALARLLLSPKQILLLDEPFAGLDADTRQVIWHSLTQMQARGEIGILMIATHQLWQEMGDVDILSIG